MNWCPTKRKILLISSRPFEHSGMTQIELDVLTHNAEIIDFGVACGWKYEREYTEFFENKKIDYFELPPKKHILLYMVEIYRLIKKNRYEKVYIHGNSSMMILEALPSKLAGATVITHCHNTKPNHFSFHYYLLKPFFSALVDHKIACSQKAAEWAYCGTKTVIKNGIDIKRFSYSANIRNRKRAELGLTDRFVVGHIGTFNVQKNHIRLISIFEEILKREPGAQLLLLGDGELRDSILQTIHERSLDEHVTYIGYVDNPEEYLLAMDVFILPSLFEGLCLVSLEAQVSGLPAIVSSVVSEETYATDCCYGLSLEDKDSKWAEKALSCRNQARKDRSDAIAAAGFSFENMMDSIRKVLLV